MKRMRIEKKIVPDHVRSSLFIFGITTRKSRIIHFWSRAAFAKKCIWKEFFSYHLLREELGKNERSTSTCEHALKCFTIWNSKPSFGVIELRSIRSFFYFFSFSSCSFPFYDSGWFTVNGEFIKCADLNIWLVSVFIPAFMPLPSHPYGMNFFNFFLCFTSVDFVVFVVVFAWFRFPFCSFIRFFHKFSCASYNGDLSFEFDGRTHTQTHINFSYRVEFVVSINWIIWFSKRQLKSGV